MTGRRLREILGFLGVATLLAAGGGLGCEPELNGTSLRMSSLPTVPGDKDSPLDWYMGFQGKKVPGNGLAVLPYPLIPTYEVRARFGVFDLDRLIPTEFAEGCVSFLTANQNEEYRLCASRRPDPDGMYVFSNFAMGLKFCADAFRVDLQLIDNGTNLIGRYRCPGEVDYTDHGSAASPYAAGERWHATLSAFNIDKGGEVGFDNFDVETGGAFDGSLDAGVAFDVFRGWKLGLDAFYAAEDLDLPAAQAAALSATNFLQSAYMDTQNFGLFPDTSAAKFVTKSYMTSWKLSDGLQGGSAAKYVKAFPKLAAVEACALEEIEADL